MTYDTIVAFYDENPARLRSPECDFGVWWTEADGHPWWRISLVEDTGEVYAVKQVAQRATVELLARFDHGEPPRDPEELGAWLRNHPAEVALKGWAGVCGQPESLKWARRRLAAHRQEVAA